VRDEASLRRGRTEPERAAMKRGTGIDLFLLLAAFASATAVAELLGATNFGTALTFGQIAFAAALAWVLLRR
jgi:hypothetical protein